MKRWAEALFAGGAMLFSLLAAGLVLELWNADLRVPFANSGDATLNLFFVKDVLENLWYFENSRLGAPHGLELYDYPVVSGETLNLILFRVLGIGSADPALVMNLFFLLTFPLAGLTAFFVLRRLGADRWAALVCAVLYAVLPYHFVRGEVHLFLTAYYAVPIGAYLAVAVLRGDELLGSRRRIAATIGLAALVAVASGSFYYSGFTAILVASAMLLRFVATRDRRVFVGGGLVVVGVLLAVSLLQLAPTIAYRATNGTNDQVAKRFAFESELYSLKLTQLVLPLDDHRLDALARLKRRYSSKFPPGDARAATLGTVGTVGFVWLLAVAFAALAGRRAREPHAGLASLTVVAFLFATIGGLGTLVAIAWPQTRAWNRLSVFIAFFALAAVALLLGALRGRLRPPVYVGVLGLVLALGVLDQTTRTYVPAYDDLETVWRSDSAYFERLERQLPDDAMVLQLPYETFPEPPAGSFVNGYEPAKAYIHTDDLRWSYGAMKGREDWAAENVVKPLPELVAAARREGFAGVLVDRLAFGIQAPSVEAEVGQLVASRPLASEGGRYLFWRL